MQKNMLQEKLFQYFNVLIMLFFTVLTFGPFWFCLVASLNEGFDFARGGVFLWPRSFTLLNYKAVFIDTTIYNAFFISAAKTVIGILTHIFFTSLIAYGMSHKKLMGRNVYSVVMVFTMFISGGLIPYYLLLNNLRLIDNFLVYIIPSMFSAYHMIILLSFFREVPESLNESAKIDGAGEYLIFFKIILPLSKPVLAVLVLFVGVSQWNSYNDTLFFTFSNSLQTIQIYLYKIISNVTEANSLGQRAADLIPNGARRLSAETIKNATMIISVIPIIIVYPFLQKYFVKGVMIGSIKG